MKDLYSFDSSQENAFITYDQVGEAYRRIFQRIGVPFVVAEADSGNMGGSKSHEYHLISPVGEDTLLTCTGCGYTANQELAVGQYMENRDNNEDIGTNNHQFLSHIIPSARFNSTIVTFQYNNALDQDWAAILTPVGRSPNLLKVETQLNNYLTQQQQNSITIDMNKVSQAKLTTMDHTTIPHIHLFVDDAIQLSSLADTSRVTVHPSDHFRLAREGDLCTSCHQGTQLSSVKAIECGHTFYLGTRYSADLDCKFRDTDGAWKIAEMGCYGIGISRLLAAVAEACHDHRGLVWPRSIAPYRACIIAAGKEPQEETMNKVYDALSQAYKGDIVIDDRPKIGFGAKMKDAELMGYPFIIVLGSKASAVGLKEDITVELHERIQNEESRISMISFNELIKKI
ncbi:MAG: hypothetical protein EXX96DRAFT_240223 [Benjaminiella poitrasii]|nr:MAG: hypothetical protein EXX96DRAFT_240223 [Benjaminiella poitrasii]